MPQTIARQHYRM